MEGTTKPVGRRLRPVRAGVRVELVTPHLYHVIQGSHVERRRESPLSRHAYAVIDSIADHRHWVGATWTDRRGGTAEQVAVGGGTRTRGCMIYLGDAFPEAYRGAVSANNIHGDRANTDLLARRGSGYVARHGPDFFACDDPGSRLACNCATAPTAASTSPTGTTPASATRRKPDRPTGRIYKITYGQPPGGGRRSPDLAASSDAELVRLLGHRNEWFVRHAQRLLQERAAAKPLTVARDLKVMLTSDAPVPARLRALWALHVTGSLSADELIDQLAGPDEHLRAWAVQLLAEDGNPSPSATSRMEAMAADDPSPLVCLYLASAAQRLPAEARWQIVERLSSRASLAPDPNVPLMVWYAAAPLVRRDPARAVRLAETSRLPRLGEFVARRLASRE